MNEIQTIIFLGKGCCHSNNVSRKNLTCVKFIGKFCGMSTFVELFNAETSPFLFL